MLRRLPRLLFSELFPVIYQTVDNSAKVKYPLSEVLLLCLLAVLAGAETITDIARFGQKKLGLLRRFRPFREGTPTRMITWAISSPRSMPTTSNAASWRGSRR